MTTMLLRSVIFVTLASSHSTQGVDNVNVNTGDVVDILETFQVRISAWTFLKQLNYFQWQSTQCNILIAWFKAQNPIVSPFRPPEKKTFQRHFISVNYWPTSVSVLFWLFHFIIGQIWKGGSWRGKHEKWNGSPEESNCPSERDHQDVECENRRYVIYTSTDTRVTRLCWTGWHAVNAWVSYMKGTMDKSDFESPQTKFAKVMF